MKLRHLIKFLSRGTLVCALDVCADAAAASASSQQAPAAPAVTLDAAGNTSRLLQEIRSEIGDAACDADDQCHSIGVGARPCGGPEAWFAWSGKVSDRDRLTAWVAKHRDARRLDNERTGVMSNCRALPDPGAACRPRAQDGKRVCQLSGQGARGRAD